MFLASRALPVLGKGIIASSKMACRSFAIDAEGHSKRVKEYEDDRREYKEAVRKLRKQYATEYEALQKQYTDIQEKTCKANEDVMKKAAEKRRQEKKSNMRHHYEQLCQTQIEKSVRRVGAIQNQLKHEAIRNRNIRHMLNEHMGYIADAYKPEEVEARVLKEMQEIVPFDRVYMAPPSHEVKDSDYLSYEDYEKVDSIHVNWPAFRAKNLELYEKWKDEQKK